MFSDKLAYLAQAKHGCHSYRCDHGAVEEEKSLCGSVLHFRFRFDSSAVKNTQHTYISGSKICSDKNKNSRESQLVTANLTLAAALTASISWKRSPKPWVIHPSAATKVRHTSTCKRNNTAICTVPVLSENVKITVKTRFCVVVRRRNATSTFFKGWWYPLLTLKLTFG